MPGPALFRKHPPTVHPRAGHVRPLPVRNPVRYSTNKDPRAGTLHGEPGNSRSIYSATAAFR